MVIFWSLFLILETAVVYPTISILWMKSCWFLSFLGFFLWGLEGRLLSISHNKAETRISDSFYDICWQLQPSFIPLCPTSVHDKKAGVPLPLVLASHLCPCTEPSPLPPNLDKNPRAGSFLCSPKAFPTYLRGLHCPLQTLQLWK